MRRNSRSSGPRTRSNGLLNARATPRARFGWIRPFLFVCLVGLFPLRVAAREIPITVLFTTDLHGRLVSRVEGDGGGLLAIAAEVDRIRAAEPNVLLLDCGDTFQGTPDSLRTQGRCMIQAMGLMKYDAWIPGNHEFDWGLKPLQALVTAAPFPVLAANLSVVPGQSSPLPEVRPFLLREVDGVRVAIIGLTHPKIPQWTLPDELGGLLFEEPVATLQKIWPDLRRAAPDVILLAVHFSLNDKGVEWAEVGRLFPELNLILGGHSHQDVAGQTVGNALYAQAGCFGNQLGRAVLVYDTVQRRVVRRETALIRIPPDAPPAESLQKVFQADLDRTSRDLARRIGVASEPLNSGSAESGGGDTGELLRAAILEASRAQAVLHGALSSEGLGAGPVTERDLWRIVPFENRLGIAWLTASEFREILDENQAQPAGRMMGLGGVWAVLNDQGKVEKIQLADGSAPHPRRRFAVVFNSYNLASGGGRWMTLRRLTQQPEARLTWMESPTRDVVRAYLLKHSPLSRARTKNGGVVRADDPALPATVPAGTAD